MAVLVVRGPQLGPAPVSGQPGHGEGAGELLSPLCHCRVPQALQLPAPLQVMSFPCLFTGFSNSQLGAFLSQH